MFSPNYILREREVRNYLGAFSCVQALPIVWNYLLSGTSLKVPPFAVLSYFGKLVTRVSGSISPLD
jgi:hypothetical protein